MSVLGHKIKYCNAKHHIILDILFFSISTKMITDLPTA